jgi:hypothetical protein
MNNRTLLDTWEAFEASTSEGISLYQTALFRFTLPGLGGRKPSGARLSSKEIAAGLKTLGSISISPDIAERLREAQKETFAILNTLKKRQRQPRYYLNKLIDWGIKYGFFPSANSPEEEKQEYTFYPDKINKVRTTARTYSYKKFTFSFDASDYTNESLQPDDIQQHLQRIEQELVNFRKHQISTLKNRLPTVIRYEACLQRILGWLYQRGDVSLVEISLNNLVPFIQLKFKFSEFTCEANKDLWFSKIIAEAKALENIKDKANCLVNLLIEYFAWLEHPPSTKTKQAYIKAVIAYSKYVYRSETDRTMALNFEDIPLINRLKVFHKEVENGKKVNSNSSGKYYLPWSDVLEVLKKLRFEAELEKTKKATCNSGEKRSLSARAKSLQDFILLGFFVLIPPPRQRVIRELELGRTLKYGIFENGRFASFEKMANPSEAKYYIHLQPEDYKTGDCYGEWLGEFPNTEFPDGGKFYDYLNKWLFRGYQDEAGEWHGMREVIATSGEKTVFLRGTKGDSFSADDVRSKIKCIFIRWTGVPIAPQDLRHLYRTYIDDPATGATEAEKESAAFWMRHSSQMAKKVYSHLNCEQKLQLGAQMSERLNQRLLNHKK